MKILQVINSLGTGGAEKLLLDTISLYRKQGIEMDILLFWNDNHQFVEALRALNCCNVYTLNESNSIKDIYKLSNIYKLSKILKRYDIAHVHLFPAQYFAVLANLLNGNSCKLIFTEHSTTNGRIQKKYLKPLERFIYSRYAKIICISNEIRIILSDYLDDKKNQFVVIENGVNLNAIESATSIKPALIHNSLKDDDILIVQVSAFRKQKDQATVIRALSLLQDENIKLLLVGDGEQRPECERLVSDLRLTDRVIFLGQRMDIPEILKSCKIIVLSSFYEGLSLSSIEGMASGKPFLTSNVPGLAEIVNGAGILFECGNEKDLASKIEQLLLNDHYYNQISLSGRQRASQFDISIMVQSHINLYQSVYGG